MDLKIYESTIQYNEKPRLIADILQSLMLWENDACQLVVTPATQNVEVSDAKAGLVIPIEIAVKSTEATPTDITFAEFTLAVSVEDTVNDGGIVPTISSETPTTSKGKAIVNLTLPEDTGYLAEETITVTVAAYTAKDGRTLGAKTCVVTIVADS